MEIIVKNSLIVLEIEFITNNINNVFVLMILSGMDSIVWWSLIAVVDKNGIKIHFNVIVLIISIGTITIVYSVSMEKLGTHEIKYVVVDRVLNGMVIFVLSFNNVMVDRFGIKILMHVNVPQGMFGMEDIVFKTPV